MVSPHLSDTAKIIKYSSQKKTPMIFTATTNFVGHLTVCVWLSVFRRKKERAGEREREIITRHCVSHGEAAGDWSGSGHVIISN